MKSNTKSSIVNICFAALFMAMTIALSSFSIPVPGGHLYLCDVAICTAAILLNPALAFIVGGVGSFLGDFFFYPAPMFVSLATHGLQAIVISLFAHYVLKNHKTLAAILGVSIGAIIMVIGYSLGRAYVYATPEYAIIKLPYEILQAAIGAVFGVLLCKKFGVEKLFNKYMAKGF